MGKVIRFLVYSLIILTLSLMGSMPAMANGQADLEPTNIEVANLYAGVTNIVSVFVANSENVSVGDFDIKLEVDDGGEGGYIEIDTITGNSIKASGDPSYWPETIKFEWTPPAAGDYTLRATVDSAEAVDETNNDNNQIELAVTVLAADPITVNVRVEGQTETIWSGEVTFFSSTITDKHGETYTIEVPTAMGALHAASVAGDFDIVIDSMFGPVDYIEEIEGEAPIFESPYPGWMFRVEWATSNIGAAEYGLADGDKVLWSYTAWGVKPLCTTVSSNSVLSGNSCNVTVEAYDGANWTAVQGIPVYIGSSINTTDADGEIKNLTLNPGLYTIYADSGNYTQYIRSNQETVLFYVPLNLKSGWNFVSVPKRLATGYSTAQQLFGSVNTAGHSIFKYDATNEWTAMGTDDVVSPLDGIWIYSTAAIELHPAFDTNPRQVPPTKQLSAGWNAIGFSDFTATSADSALTSVEDKWAILIGFDATTQSYEVSIINKAPSDDDPHSEDRDMNCWKGYWLHVTTACQLAAVSS